MGGIDSYDQDKAGKSTSLGSAMVYQRFLNLNEPGDYPVAEEYYSQCLTIPIYPTLEDVEQNYIIDMIKNFYD